MEHQQQQQQKKIIYTQRYTSTKEIRISIQPQNIWNSNRKIKAATPIKPGSKRTLYAHSLCEIVEILAEKKRICVGCCDGKSFNMENNHFYQ